MEFSCHSIAVMAKTSSILHVETCCLAKPTAFLIFHIDNASVTETVSKTTSFKFKDYYNIIGKAVYLRIPFIFHLCVSPGNINF